MAASGGEVDRQCQLSVILPAYNEQDAIHRVLAGSSRPWLTSRSAEILVVDDASTDGTPELAERLPRPMAMSGASHSLCRAARGGSGPQVGIRQAQGALIVMLDADGTYPCDAIR